jgi:glycosyltransferase involved in cell wall biosynthesis
MPAVPTPRICLSMIVRNERAVIRRCLTAALPLLDAAVVCDTGSSDDTIAAAQAVLEPSGVPFVIPRHAWRDFGTNRTRAIREAERFTAGLGWSREDTYWLFLDADLELIGAGTFDRRLLRADACLLRERSEALAYWTLRLASARQDWTVVGPTHEQYQCPDMHQPERLTGLWVRDYHDGGSRADKYPRDIRLLGEELERSPNHPRTLFYLAQSYRAAGDPMKALVLYRRRAAIDDGHGEVWYSKWWAARILAEGGPFDLARQTLIDVAALAPARAEPYADLARLHRRHGRFDEATRFALDGLARPFRDDHPFPRTPSPRHASSPFGTHVLSRTCDSCLSCRSSRRPGFRATRVSCARPTGISSTAGP